MGVIPSATKPVENVDMQPFLSRIGSLHVQTDNGEKLVCRYHDLPLDKQEQIGRIVQLLLRSRSLYTHLQNYRGSFNIVYKKEKEREFFIIAGKTIDLGQSLEETREEKSQRKSLLSEFHSYSEKVGVGSDVLSFIRNMLAAFETAALENIHSKASIAIDGLRFLGGAAGVVGGSILISKGAQKMLNSKEDEEFNLGFLQALSGTGYLAFGISSIMLSVSSYFASAAGFAEAVSTFAISPSLLVMNVGFALIGLYQLTMAGSFRSDFNQAIEKGGVKGGIDFLHENLFLNQEEQEMVDAIADSTERAEKTKEILDRKRAHLGRRIGSEVVEEIAPKVAELKNRGHADAESASLLEKVSEANSREIVKAALLIIVALASIAGALALGPAGTFAFFAALAICWFIVDCAATSNLTADLVWKLHQMVMGFILLLNEGPDEEFMRFLEHSDPTLARADMQVKTSVYLEARAELGGGVYDLFQKIRGKTSLSQGFFDLGCDSEFQAKTEAEAMIRHIQKKHPRFWETIEKDFSRERFENAVESGAAGWDALWIATEFGDFGKRMRVLVAKEFREMMEEVRSAPVPAKLDFSELMDTLKSSMPLFYGFLTKNIGEEKAIKALMQAHEESLAKFPDMEFLSDEERLKPVALDLLSSLFTSEETRSAVFGRFDSAQIQRMAKKKEKGLPLMQLGCSLGAAFSSLERGKTAYGKIKYPELLLSEDEAMILRGHNEYRKLAAKEFPEVYKLAMKTPAIQGRSIQEALEEDLLSLEKPNIEGAQFTVPHQTRIDFHRSPKTSVQGERFESGEVEGMKVLSKLSELAKEDEKLFHLLAALYSQTSKNFVLYFQEEMKRNEVLTGLYIPTSNVLEQRFTQKEDGSFEMNYDFQFTLIPELDGEMVKLPLTATFRLEKENGEWVCRNPVYSDTIQVDGHPR